jgi:hypothetical protein
MTELQLYKFITDNHIEYHWDIVKHDVWMFIPFHHLYDFNKMLGSGITDEDGIECIMKDGYICFEMVQVCEYFDIDPENVFNLEN